MLSLKTYDIPTFEVEAPDGEILHVLPASKRTIDKISHMQADGPDALQELYDTLAECLSINREDRTVTAEELETVPIPVVRDMMVAYTQFVRAKVDGAKN